MLENLKLLLAYGTDGVSFGFLNEDRTIDKNRCQEFLENVKMKDAKQHSIEHLTAQEIHMRQSKH